MTEFKLPELGENIVTGDVVRVLVTPGEVVRKDQAVLELETDKATIEVPSSVGGRIGEIKVKPGDKIKVGQVVFTVDEQEARSEEPGAESQVSTPPPPPAPSAPPAPSTPSNVVEISRVTPRAVPPPAPVAVSTGPVPAAPSTRRFARELGVSIGEVAGSGPGGRISLDDVKAHARAIVLDGGGRAAPAPLPDFSKWGEVERQPMRAVRRATATHVSQAWATVPHVTQFDKADITALEELRKAHAKDVEAAGGKLTITAVALKVVASALKTFPQFNASVDMAAEEIVLKKYVHIGVAVDTDRGLLVPVIRDVDRKNITELSVELATAAERAKARKLAPEDMQGGSFSISNLGGIGGTFFTPIVNHPEVAILGLSRAVMEPVWINGLFQPRLVMPLSLSYDHRVIDGADGIRFLRWIVQAFEQPFLLPLAG